MSYLIDTDAIAHVENRPDSESVIRGMLAQVDGGQLKTVEQVLDELKRWPAIHDMFNRRRRVMIVRQYIAPVMTLAGQISDDFPFLYDLTGSRNPDPADPWLIACSKHYGLTLVTDERQLSEKKIPFVCRQQSLRVRCISGPNYFVEAGIAVKAA